MFLATNLRNKSIANIEERKEDIIPIIIGRISIKDDVVNIVKNSTNPEIEIAGIPIKKESLAAVFLSTPENKAEVKVIPDLETPGNIERAWEIPNKITSLKLISENNLFLLPKISEAARIRAMSIEMIEMDNKPLKFELVKSGQNNLRTKPIELLIRGSKIKIIRSHSYLS